MKDLEEIFKNMALSEANSAMIKGGDDDTGAGTTPGDGSGTEAPTGPDQPILGDRVCKRHVTCFHYGCHSISFWKGADNC